VFDSRGYFEQKLARWQHERNVESAADLVASALVLGRHTDARDAARFLLEPDSEVTAAVKVVAELVLAPEDQAGRVVTAELKDIDIEADVVRLRVRALRSQLRDDPRNALAWVDVSRAYSMLGQPERSIRAMERALGLVRGNRFILRSAARLFVHVDDPLRAHGLLTRADATREDPWLVAAEIAVAAVAGRNPMFVRQGRRLLEARRFPLLHTAELTSALATLEMTAGDQKSARRLFKESLADPTDNSLAQAEWARTKISGVEVDPALLNRPRSFEARALQDYKEGRWILAIRQCEAWLLDEPFSSRPAALGSYLAGITQRDYRLAEDFANRSLRANPKDPLLLNNLVWALANQGRIDEARERFGEITEVSKELVATILATRGLLRFRTGHPVEGRQSYLAAIEEARRHNHKRVEALAALHLAREELLSDVETATASVRAAAKACEGVDDLEVAHMLQALTSTSGKGS